MKLKNQIEEKEVLVRQVFKVQKKILYAIEAVVDIAMNSGTEPVQNISIAERQGIPKRYLEQTLQELVKSKILVGSRGPKGGYRLSRERRKIKLSEIVNAVIKKTTVDMYDKKSHTKKSRFSIFNLWTPELITFDLNLGFLVPNLYI